MWKEEQTHTHTPCSVTYGPPHLLICTFYFKWRILLDSCGGQSEIQQSGLLQCSDDNSAQVPTSNLLL